MPGFVKLNGATPTPPAFSLDLAPTPPPGAAGLASAATSVDDAERWVSLGLRIVELVNKFRPLMDTLKPAPVITEPTGVGDTERIVERIVIREKDAQPAPPPEDAEKEKALRGEVELLIGKLDAARIRKGFFMAGPFALSNTPNVGKFFFETHRADTVALVTKATDDELRAMAQDVVGMLKGKSLEIAKDGLQTLLGDDGAEVEE